MSTRMEIERFIPVEKAERIDRLSLSSRFSADDRERFLLLSRILASHFHFEFHAKTETLKAAYRIQ